MNPNIVTIPCEDPDQVAEKAASIVSQQILSKSDSVLGLATGSTPEKTYDKLIKAHQNGLSFEKVKTFNLDEYLGLSPEHPQSYRHFMQKKLFNHINIKPENTHILNGLAEDAEKECVKFESKIKESGGVDLWILGIGQNGHIAFNEPGSAADSRTSKVALSESTIQANSDGRFFEDPKDVPRFALTAGIGTIMEARKIILLATGQKKAEAIKQAITGQPSTDCPASFLQSHPNCTFILDHEAASSL